MMCNPKIFYVVNVLSKDSILFKDKIDKNNNFVNHFFLNYPLIRSDYDYDTAEKDIIK